MPVQEMSLSQGHTIAVARDLSAPVILDTDDQDFACSSGESNAATCRLQDRRISRPQLPLSATNL
ncbi:MAG: hypothetical protein K8F58_14385, partial [Bauldia sp.]|nr:hypothetical protein [Bauldia sp.]